MKQIRQIVINTVNVLYIQSRRCLYLFGYTINEAHIHTYTRKHTHTRMHTCTHALTNTNAHMHEHTRIRTHMHVRTHERTHTHTNTHRHTHIQSNMHTHTRAHAYTQCIEISEKNSHFRFVSVKKKRMRRGDFKYILGLILPFIL
jgi:hypothetical protein